MTGELKAHGSPKTSDRQWSGGSRGTARGGKSQRSVGKGGAGAKGHQSIWCRLHSYEVERRRKRAGARAHGKWTRRIGTRARKSTMTMVDRAGHPAVADDELHLAMNPTGHETRRDQRVGDKGYERERCEALPNRSTKKPCLMTAHTRALCAKRAGRSKPISLPKQGISPSGPTAHNRDFVAK